ncbi:unnamed protein product, partial [Closterium sp. Yama58-4]
MAEHVESLTFEHAKWTDVERWSVLKCTKPADVSSSLLGVRNRKENRCGTCGKSAQTCTGHFGHISFEMPVIPPAAAPSARLHPQLLLLRLRQGLLLLLPPPLVNPSPGDAGGEENEGNKRKGVRNHDVVSLVDSDSQSEGEGEDEDEGDDRGGDAFGSTQRLIKGDDADDNDKDMPSPFRSKCRSAGFIGPGARRMLATLSDDDDDDDDENDGDSD